MGKLIGKKRGHTGQTDAGNTRDVKLDRIGRVTIYQRGKTYDLYYREARKTERRKIDGYLAVARARRGRYPLRVGYREEYRCPDCSEFAHVIMRPAAVDAKRLAGFFDEVIEVRLGEQPVGF